MRTGSGLGAAGLAAAGVAAALALAAVAAPAVAHDPESVAAPDAAGERLGAAIQRAIRDGGPFFTATERSVIERACDYPAGSWDGFDVNMNDGVLVCRNGRRADSPEVRAVMAAAAPRIAARVQAAMARPEIREAIDEVARTAREAALAGGDHVRIARTAIEASARARDEAARAIRDAQAAAARVVDDPEVQRAIREAEAAAREAGEEARRAVEESQRARRR
jgi:hypothetical protein